MDARKGVQVGAMAALIGAATSGPIGVAVVAATHPQPLWRDAETFVGAYHSVQLLPYAFGFLLVGGFVVLIASLHALAPAPMRFRTTSAVAFTGAFAAMIFVNYSIQTTFVPAVIHDWSPANGPLVSGLTMVNPRSLGWALEMWGYAVLGVATWFCAALFVGGRLARIARLLFIANGPASILTAIATAVSPDWVLTPVGYAASAAWNVLIIALAACAFAVARTNHHFGAVDDSAGA
jgi:hypothetical protein